MKRFLRSLALIGLLLPNLALAQSAPANLPFHSVYGRIGAVPGDTGPGQAITFEQLASGLFATTPTLKTLKFLNAAAHLTTISTSIRTGVADVVWPSHSGEILSFPTPQWIGAWCDGTHNDSTVLQSAINNMPASGGVLYTPPGSICRVDSGIVIPRSRNNITLMGVSNNDQQALTPSQWIFTGSGSGIFLDARDTGGLRIVGMDIGYSNSGFTGTLVHVGSSQPGVLVASQITIENSILRRQPNLTGTAKLLVADGTVDLTVNKVQFIRGKPAFTGQALLGQNVRTTIKDSSFVQSESVPINGCGESMVLSGNGFEPLTNGQAGAFVNTGSLYCKAMTWNGNWFGDVSVTGGTWIDGYFQGLSFTGNQMAGVGVIGGTGIALRGPSTGVNIDSNRFETLDTAVNVATAGTGLRMGQNTYVSVTTPVTNPSNVTAGDFTLASTGVNGLSTVNSNVGACGDGTHVAQPTFNAKGLATACASVAITGAPATTVTVGTTTVTSGTTARVLFDNAGVLGEYTTAQLTAQINAATAALSGAVPAWPNNTTSFFRGDGTYAAIPFSSITGQATLAQFPNMAANTALVNATAGSAVPTAFAMPSCSTAASALIWTTSTGFGCNAAITAASMPTTGLTGTLQAAQEPAHTGDVTNTAGSLALTIANTAVTYAKMQNVSATGRLLGRANAGAGVIEEISLGAAFVTAGTQLQTAAFTGDVTTPSNSLATTLATVNSNVGTFGSATQSAVPIVNAKGLTTAISNVTITPAASSITGGAALTKTDDTNVTLTLGGAPTTSLLAASSLTLGWTGQLSLARGGTAANLTASNGGIPYSTSSALAILAGTVTSRQMLQSGASAPPNWSTATWPATTTANRILYSTSANVVSEIVSANSGALVTDGSGVPSISTTLPNIAHGTPTSIVLTNATGTAASLTAGNVTTNANLTGDITSVGNATTLAAGNAANLNSGTLSGARLDGNYGGWALQNCTLAASVASNILTVALKDNAGNDPSATSPCNINYRNVTAATGSTTLVPQTAALSITTNAVGASLGTSNNFAFRFWVVSFNNGGSNVPALINCSTSAGISPLNEGVVASSTAMSAGATSAGVFYTPNGTTVSSKAFRILGYVEYNATGLATAGTYASGPNFIQTFGPGIHKPGNVVQSQFAFTSSPVSTGATTTLTTTNSTVNITPTSAANLIKFSTSGSLQLQATGATQAFATLYRGSTALNAKAELYNNGSIANVISATALVGIDAPNATSAQTYAIKINGAPAPSTGVAYPESSSTATIVIDEIMG